MLPDIYVQPGPGGATVGGALTLPWAGGELTAQAQRGLLPGYRGTPDYNAMIRYLRRF
jgi:hypothetical protein